MGLTDYDLSGMDPKSAKEYVMAVLVTYKETKKKIESLYQDKGLWENRMHLAEQKGVFDLREEAGKRVKEIAEEIVKLEGEAAEYRKQVDLLSGQLKFIQSRIEPSLEAEQLLAELSLLVGEEDKTAKAFKEFEAQAALEALKNRLKEEEK